MPESTVLHRRSIRVRLVDLPGSLHQLTGLVADAGVNIARLEVVSRERPGVWDDIELTAPDEAQLDGLVRTLREHGLTVIGLPAAWAMRDWAADVLHSLEVLSECEDDRSAAEVFSATAAALTNVDHAFVLMDTGRPDAAAGEWRWSQIRGAAAAFDPDSIKWCGDVAAARIVMSAMRAARPEGKAGTADHPVGAVVGIPVMSRRPAHLVVVGRRPVFLGPELGRLEMFARVAAPHLSPLRSRASA